METSEIRKKLQNYIASAEEEKVKAIFTVLEGDIAQMFGHWDDPEFVAEMDRRMKEIKDGTVKAIPMEEMFLRLDNRISDSKHKHAV